jgi:hypothetical protein
LVKDFKNTDIYDDAEDQGTLAELRLKENIILAQESMLLSKQKMTNYFRRMRRYDKSDMIVLEGNILLVWDFIQQMVLSKGIKDSEKKEYDLIKKANKGNQLEGNNLIILVDFIQKKLHEINIANLFMSKGKTFEQKLKDKF